MRLIIPDWDNLLLTKEFRRELNDFDYPLPGGRGFDALVGYNKYRWDIDPHCLLAAKRECEEETWLVAQEIFLFYVSKVWATVERDLHYYVVLKFSVHPKWQQLGTGENIPVEPNARAEAIGIIKQWWMQEDRSVGVLMRYLAK